MVKVKPPPRKTLRISVTANIREKTPPATMKTILYQTLDNIMYTKETNKDTLNLSIP